MGLYFSSDLYTMHLAQHASITGTAWLDSTQKKTFLSQCRRRDRAPRFPCDRAGGLPPRPREERGRPRWRRGGRRWEEAGDRERWRLLRLDRDRPRERGCEPPREAGRRLAPQPRHSSRCSSPRLLPGSRSARVVGLSRWPSAGPPPALGGPSAAVRPAWGTAPSQFALCLARAAGEGEVLELEFPEPLAPVLAASSSSSKEVRHGKVRVVPGSS